MLAKMGTKEEQPRKMGIVLLILNERCLGTGSTYFSLCFFKYLCYLPNMKQEDTEEFIKPYHCFAREATDFRNSIILSLWLLIIENQINIGTVYFQVN